MTRIVGPPRSRRRRWLFLSTTLAAIAAAVLFIPSAFAVHDLGFQLDGEVSAQAYTVPGPPAPPSIYDWGGNCSGSDGTLTQACQAHGIFQVSDSGGVETVSINPALVNHDNVTTNTFNAASFARDFQSGASCTLNSTSTTFCTGDDSTYATGSKDTLGIGNGGWQCNHDNNVNSKIDIMNAYSASYFTGGNGTGDHVVYFGLEKNKNNGTNDVGVWLLQGSASCSAPTGHVNFTGGHRNKDVLVVSEFSNGGGVSTIQAFQWAAAASGPLSGDGGCIDSNDNPNPKTGGCNGLPIATSNSDCKTAGGNDSLCATTNANCVDTTLACGKQWNTTVATPWLTSDATGGVGRNQIVSPDFFEGGINLTKVFQASGETAPSCFNTVVPDTRSSDTITATLFDFVTEQLGECKSSIVTTPKAADGTSPPPTSLGAGGSVQVKDSAVLTVTGAQTWSGTVKFFLCGPIATGNCSSGGTQVGAAAGIAVDQTTTNPILSDAATISAAGRYCWRATFTPISPPDIPSASDPAAGSTSTSECFSVVASPSINTTADPTSGHLGDTLNDSATLSGTSNLLGTGSVTFYLYAPGQTCQTDGSGSPVFTRVASSAVSTNGPFTTASTGGGYHPAGGLVAGTYHWLAIFSGDTNNPGPVNSGCQAEPVVITAQPSINTQADPTSGHLGDTLNDSATLSGTSNLLGTGTVTFYLFAPGVTCNTDGTGAVYSQTITSVSTNGPFTTFPGYGPPLVAGTYHWLAVFSGDTNNPGPVDSGCASEPVVITAQPTIDTDQTPKTGHVGDSISDSASLHNTSNLDGTGSVTIYLYAPGETCQADGSGGTLEATYMNVTTEGPFTAGPVTATQAGVYHWLAIFSGDGNNNGPINSGCASEPVTITAQPTIDTDQTPKTGHVGDPISDSASLHDTSNLDGTGTVTIYLYAPGETCQTDGSGGTLEATYNNVTTEGPFTAGPVTATEAGVYHWLAIFSGDGNNDGPVNSGCASEPVTITAQPTIDTDQTPKTGNVGDPISDSASLHNTSNLDGTGTVTIYLYAPGETCQADGSGGTLEATYNNVTTEGPFTAGPVTATQAGVYHWLAIFSGDGNNDGPVDSGCASEPVTITAQPTIDTDQTPKTGHVGDSISDSASLHNTSNLDGTGTVTIYLYAPGETCQADGSGGTLEATYNNVTTEGPFTAGPVTATQAGVYHWLAIFSGDGNNAGPIDSGCASEPVTITAQPTIDTDQTPKTGHVGDSISDSASLHNTSSLDGTGTVTIYLYAPGETCNADGSGGTLEATYNNVTTEGPFTAGPVTATEAGVYHWLAIFSGDGNNDGPINSGCASEPVTITAQPTIDTDQTPKTGHVGDSIGDSASLHDTSNLDGTGTVTIYLYAPGETCQTDGSGGTLEATYNNVTTEGPFTAGPVTATQAGVYHWLAIFSGDGNNDGPVNSGCASEPVTITAQPTIDTLANPTSGNAPVTLNDSATLHDTSNLDGTGTVTFYLFAPGTACNTDGTGAVYSQTIPNVSDNGPFNTSPGYLATAAGTYQWLAIFSGDGNNDGPVDSGCGNEPVVVTTPGQGCTPGFWKNHTNAWDSSSDSTVSTLLPFLVSPFGFDPSKLGGPPAANSFNNQPFFGYGTPQTNPGIFGLPGGPYRNLSSSLTLIGALNLGGGGFAALARHGTAALLSSASVDYPYSPDEVLNGVRNAFLSGNSNQVSATFPDGVLTDLTNANNLDEKACPTH